MIGCASHSAIELSFLFSVQRFTITTFRDRDVKDVGNPLQCQKYNTNCGKGYLRVTSTGTQVCTRHSYWFYLILTGFTSLCVVFRRLHRWHCQLSRGREVFHWEKEKAQILHWGYRSFKMMITSHRTSWWKNNNTFLIFTALVPDRKWVLKSHDTILIWMLYLII